MDTFMLQIRVVISCEFCFFKSISTPLSAFGLYPRKVFFAELLGRRHFDREQFPLFRVEDFDILRTPLFFYTALVIAKLPAR